MRKLLVTCDRCGAVLWDSKTATMELSEPHPGTYSIPYQGGEDKDFCRACAEEIEAFHRLSQLEKSKSLTFFIQTKVKRTKKK